jgi:hypothetical protein
LLSAALLALVQQQWLLRRPPRLESLGGAAASAGSAALQARFSRPMALKSLQQASRLEPARPHRWLGEGEQPQLTLLDQKPVRQPLQLALAGQDRRGQALGPSRWHWDPRPRLLAVVPVASGEQLQLRDHDGRWLPLSPVWPRLQSVEPQGDGSGVAFSGEDSAGNVSIWRVGLRQPAVVPADAAARPPAIEPPRPLVRGQLLFAHLSSNHRGDLLVQSSGGAQELVTLLPRSGGRLDLPLRAGGAMRLLPEGGGVVVPTAEGLALENLPPRQPRRQMLPGSRDLLAFCPRSGRALLLRHWPDYRRSLERVEPGLPPRQLWLGSAAVVGGACAGGGERVWLLLLDGQERPVLSLLALDARGAILRQRRLEGWELEPGAGLHVDPGTQQLLTTLRPAGADQGDSGAAAASRPVLIDASTLEATPIQQSARLSLWLPPG